VASVEVEDRAVVKKALAWHGAGMDFADALHLAASGEVTEFVSFDRDLAKVARRVGAKPEVAAP
jgi:predicted nucleic acid-binding protein